MSNQTGTRLTTNFNSILENSDFCEHCSESDLSKAVGYTYESDSFGFVATFICCQECLDKAEEEEGNQEVCCYDCKQTKLRKDTREWRWYDFYAPQGDEPYIICDECWKLEKHLLRMRKDRADYEAEMDSYDD